MADNRTGLSPADIAENFRDRCGDGSVEWVYTPTQTWVLLDAADMLDEVADTPKCETCESMLDCDECLRADASQKERKRVDYENAKLRELVRDMAAEMRGLGVDFARVGWCDYADRMRELGVDE